MSSFHFGSRPTKLREAAATIFALSTILPLLIFVFFMWRFDLIWETEIQIAIFIAVAVALTGFEVFRRLVGRIADLAHSLSAPATDGGPAITGAVPAVGTIGEIGEIAGAFGRLLDDLRGSTQRLEDLVFKLATLNEMVDLAKRIPSVHDLLDLVLERSMRVVRANIGSIMLLEHEPQTLRLVAARGLPEDVRPGLAQKVGDGVAGRVVEIGEPVLVQDIETDTRFAKVSDPRYGGGSFIGMPIRVGDRTVGVLNLAKKEHGSSPSTDQVVFSFTDLQFLTTLIGYAAYALDNARLLDEAQTAVRQLAEVVEVQRAHVHELAEKSRLLEEAKTEAETANRFKSQFLAVMSHELRTPLNAIIGFARVLLKRLDGALTEQQDAHLRTMHASGVHLLQLINSVLDMASIEAGKMALRAEEVDMRALVAECLEASDALARGKDIALETDMPSAVPSLTADRIKVKQILLNLLSNAIKFTVAGHVRVRVRAAGDVMQVSVTDTGVGIAAEDLPELFEPFRHRESPVTGGVGGTGLGLAISKKFVEAHGGSIWVETQPKHGSTFHFTLPHGSPDRRADAPVMPPIPPNARSAPAKP